jgi:hypothetical protein
MVIMARLKRPAQYCNAYIINTRGHWFHLLEMTDLGKEVDEGQTKNIFQIFKEYFFFFLLSLLCPKEGSS